MNSGRQRAGSSPGEWALGVLGAVVTLALVGFLAYQMLAAREADPRIRVEITAVEETAHGFEAEVRVCNDGGTTAEAVHLVANAGPADGTGRQAAATISYVPPQAVLVFPVPRPAGDVQVRIAGYAVP